jgi:DNA-binding MarR family transcriptional regulator
MQASAADEDRDNMLSLASPGQAITDPDHPSAELRPREMKPCERMESLFDDIVDLSRTIADGVDILLVDLDLSHARWQVLKWVAGGEDPTVTGIARELRLSRQAVQRVANELGELGLVRIANRTRRTISPRIEVTPQGGAAYFEADARILAWCNHLQKPFSEIKFELGRSLITGLRDAAASIDEGLALSCRQGNSVDS